MHIPEREKKTREDLIEYMKKCAKQYVPEWRYDEEHPDAGTALVSLFADMMYDNIQRFNLSSAGDMFSFFDEVHAKMLPAKPAEGFITFQLPEGLDRVQEVMRGTRLAAETGEGPVVFETQDEVLVRRMEIEKIYLSNPKDDTIFQVYGREQGGIPSFFLFQNGQENLQRHRICFCFSHGLEIYTHAEAMLSFQLKSGSEKTEEWNQAILDETRIRFSYGTAEGFHAIPGKTLQENSQKKAESPEAEEEQSFSPDGVLRFTLTGGEEGIAAKEEFRSMYVIQAEILDVDFFSQIYISSLSLSLQSRGQKPDFIHVNGTDQEMEDFLVFGETPAVYDEFYIASEEVFQKAGAKIQIEFDLDFVKIPLEMTAEEKKAWKTVMKKRDFVPDREYDITVCEVIWEYYNGYGWTRLKEGHTYRNLFAAEEGLRESRVRMELLCPMDIQRVLVNSAETYAIRARIYKMQNAYKTKGAYIAPVAGRVTLSYDYSVSPLSPAEIIRWNHLEREEISEKEMKKEGFAVPLCEKNPDTKTACYLGFAYPPVDGPLKLLFAMHDTMPRTMPPVEWEYLGTDGWEKMHPIDGTQGFHHTGLVSWFGNQKICRQILFGENLFWIRLVDEDGAYQNGTWGEFCPKIDGIYPNSTRILGIETMEELYGIPPYAEEKILLLPFADLAELHVWVLERKEYIHGSMEPIWELWRETEELDRESSEKREYTADRQTGIITFPKYMRSSCLNEQNEITVRVRCGYCQGEKGNQKVGKINRLNQSVGFISGSSNPVASVGGMPGEKVLEAVKRNAQILRHGYRCVSAGDYEDMAWEAARNISKVKCFSGYDQEGKRQPGAVTLVILPKEYEEDSFSFEKTRREIYEYLSVRMDENIVNLGKFYIVRPEMIRLNVKASIELQKEKEVFRVRKRVVEELEHFLHPLYGNFYGEGWEIGLIPNQNQIEHALKRVDGVKHIHQLTLRKFCRGRFEEYEVQEEQALPFYLLPKSGKHEILIEADSGRERHR